MICKHYWERVFIDTSPVTYSSARVVDHLICKYCGTELRGTYVVAEQREALRQREVFAEHEAYQP